MYDKRVEHFIFSQKNFLGAGSYGQVYAGMNEKTGEKVAVKILNRSFINKNFHLKRGLHNEIKIMSKLTSPNIVKLLDVYETSNNYYLIQEYCQNGDLDKYLSKKGPLSEVQAKQLITQLLKGFLCLITAGVMHRDLKPANILLHNEFLKMADFGFAKRLENCQIAMTQSIVGTPLYMSPQLLNRQKYSNKCDIWSLGIIFYECLYGRTPWTGRSSTDLNNNIQIHSLKFPGIPHVSDLAKEFISKCLELKEENRFSWDDIYSHPYFSSEFSYSNILKSNNQIRLDDRVSYLINDLRAIIEAKQLNTKVLIMQRSKKRLSFVDFSTILLAINSCQCNEDLISLFENQELSFTKYVDIADLTKWFVKHKLLTEANDFLNVQDNNRQERTLSINIGRKTDTIIEKLRSIVQKYAFNLEVLFQKYDYNHDGFLNEEELSKMLQIIDPSLQSGEITWIFLQFDTNRDGQISMAEFLNSLSKQATEEEVQEQCYNVNESNGRPVSYVMKSFPGPGQKLQQIQQNFQSQSCPVNHF